MVRFAVEVDKTLSALSFFKFFQENNVQVFLKAKGDIMYRKGSMFFLFEFEPLVPKLWKAGGVLVLLAFVLRFSFGVHSGVLFYGLLGLGVLFACFLALWRPFFYFWVFRHGLEKKGYKGKIRRLSEAELKEVFLVGPE